ncbi:MAG: hypothetical protein SGJ27_22735 [Candidatus Melainabacteria bacterium]|nr:hypothetical protein [Candidatus Melainabacteria bacterium]
MKIARMVRSVTLAATALLLSLAPAMAQGNGQTTLDIYNGSNNPVKVFLTLNNYTGNNPGFVQSVANLPWRHKVNMKVINQFQGSFNLRNGDTASLTMPAGQAIAGNIVFGSAPNNCRTQQNPNGQNLGEFTLNNNTAAFFNNNPPYSQEAIDISCVNGVNSKMQFDMTQSNGSGNWGTAGFNNVTTFANKKFTPPPSSNLGIPGVFPVGCDICTGQVDAGCSPTWTAYTVGNATNICNVQRPGTRSGGTVKITYNGEFPIPASQTNLSR